MSLRECPECDKPISTDARACPHCGCPLSHGQKRQSYLGPLVLAFFVIAALGMFLDQPLRQTSDALKASPNFVAGPRCDAKAADGLMGKFISAGVLHKLETGREVPRIYVLEEWYRLTIDEKRALDNAIQCQLTRGIGTPKLFVYHDGRNGKEVATSDQYGFRLD